MKKLIALLLAMTMVCGMVACSSSSTETATAEAATTEAATTETATTEAAATEEAADDTLAREDMHFTLVSPLIGHDYWVTVEDGMKAANADYGVDTQYVGPAEINIDEQIKAVETAIATGSNGIITMALDPAAFEPVIKQATDAGIPVILIDTDAPDSTRDYYAGTSNYASGVEAGQAMIEATGGEANIGIITGAINAANLNERIDGFMDAIADEPGMTVLVTEPSDTDLLKATEKAQSMIQTYPEMNAFFGVSATDVQGAAKVVIEQGLEDSFSLVGFDDLEDTLNYVRDGVVDATIVQQPYQMGYLGVELLVQILEGNAPAEAIIDTGVTVVTADNVDSY